MKKLFTILIALILFGCNNNHITEPIRTVEYVFLDCCEPDTLDKQTAVVFAILDSICWTSLDTVIIDNTIDIKNNVGYRWYRFKIEPSNTTVLKTSVYWFPVDSIITRKATVKNINTTEIK